MITPFYDRDGITLYNADCLDVLREIGHIPGSIITDPPYGIGSIWKGGKGHGWGKARQEGVVRNQWDSSVPSKEVIDLILEIAPRICIWGGNYFQLPVSRGWLVWNKPERGFTLAEAELAWTNKDTVIRVFDGKRSDSNRVHPTQKTIELMEWTIEKIAETDDVILDPYAGSGTTLVAARKMGHRAIGIEISKEYCDIIVRRLSQTVMF
jgi:site-specific DNA-methyltransferase (adenine-specific)